MWPPDYPLALPLSLFKTEKKNTKIKKYNEEQNENIAEKERIRRKQKNRTKRRDRDKALVSGEALEFWNSGMRTLRSVWNKGNKWARW